MGEGRLLVTGNVVIVDSVIPDYMSALNPRGVRGHMTAGKGIMGEGGITVKELAVTKVVRCKRKCGN